MKGLEWQTILMIIIVAAVIFIIVVAVIIPVWNTGKSLGSDITFSEFCYLWSLRSYEEGFNEEIVRSGKPYGTPAQHCMGYDEETCKNMCKGV